ncbi:MULTISPECIES: DUF5345 family protein [Bacillus]|uniref:Negative regulator YxlC n=2 Tax=Bacillus TaxID=1386 RepID=A0A0M4FW02_9BACI|nr:MULTISPECIES: DUF5345 family protein [Bacillus]ALC82855.1 hypothetical protein AM592_15600 [Bacillus gobiensis]MBP1081821.1 Ca2+/Na+ antiporter [Bacillus capparidis]MED1096470.1 DUF5345 family protein [Bacillus capparidis]
MKESKEWTEQFKSELNKLEDMQEVEVPEQYQLMNVLQEYKARRQKTFKREIVAFLLTAILVLAMLVLISLKVTTAFLWIQGLALFFIPIIFLAEKKRRSKQDEVTKL